VAYFGVSVGLFERGFRICGRNLCWGGVKGRDCTGKEQRVGSGKCGVMKDTDVDMVNV
jgi:hypothetical protein